MSHQTLRHISKLAVIAALVSFGAISSHAAEPGPVTVKKTVIEDLKAVFATVQSVDTTIARARIGGTVVELTVDEGSRVQAGQMIAKINDPKLALELAALDARIAARKSESQLARIDLDRATKLRKSGAASQARVDEARTALDVVERNLLAMRAERAVNVELSAEGAVLAPATGRVLEVRTPAGSFIMPGETIATIADEAYVLRMQIPERHARHIREGDSVLVGRRGRIDSDLSDLAQGRVIKVYPEIVRGRVVADVGIDDIGGYFVGERTRVYIKTGTRAAYVVPENYVYFRHGLAFVRIEDVGEVVVEVGGTQPDGLEILSGIADGDVLRIGR